MWAFGCSLIQRPTTVFIQAINLTGSFILTVTFVLVWLQWITLEKGDLLVKDAVIAGALYITGCDKRQPQQIVGNVGAHAATRRRMPPMQNIACLKLVTCSQQNLFTGEVRSRVEQRHYILQLVSVAKCAA